LRRKPGEGKRRSVELKNKKGLRNQAYSALKKREKVGGGNEGPLRFRHEWEGTTALLLKEKPLEYGGEQMWGAKIGCCRHRQRGKRRNPCKTNVFRMVGGEGG